MEPPLTVVALDARQSLMVDAAFMDWHVKSFRLEKVYGAAEEQCQANGGQGCSRLGLELARYSEVWGG